MKNKGTFALKTTKNDAGILGSEASGYINSLKVLQIDNHAIQKPTYNLWNSKDSFLIHTEQESFSSSSLPVILKFDRNCESATTLPAM